MKRGAAITGIGCVSAFGVGVPAIWRSLLENRLPSRTQRRRLDGSYGPALDSPSAESLSSLPSTGVPRVVRPTLMARISAEEAWASAGAGASVPSERAGLMVNRNFGQHQIIGQYYETLWSRGPSAVSGLQFVQTIANSVLGALAIQFQLRGPSTMQFGAPSLGAALDLLRDDACDVFLAGGFDELSDYIFELCHACNLTSDSRDLAGRPYDAASDGLIPGEGSAFFVLENPQYAKSRSVKVLAYLKGYATTTDRRAVRNPADRDANDIAEAIRRGLCDANVGAEDVSFIAGAANGVCTIDQPELVALARVFSRDTRIFSIKGSVGETWGAAGGISMLAAIGALNEDVILPMSGTIDNPKVRPASNTAGTSMPRRPRTAVVLSLDMSGQNTAFIISDQP